MSEKKIKIKKKKLPYSPPKGAGTQTVTTGQKYKHSENDTSFNEYYKNRPEKTTLENNTGGYKAMTRTVIKDGKKVKEKYLVPHKSPLKFKMKKK